MSEFHAAILHPDESETYCGVVDQDHVDQVRALAALDEVPRVLRDHPRLSGAFYVLREDGDLDYYVPVDAAPYEVREPDPGPAAARRQPRKLSGPAYIDGAERLGGQAIGGAMDHPEAGPRFTWHTTECPSGANYFASMGSYLRSAGVEPQVLYDPVSDRLGQFGPLTQSGRALRNDGTRRTNREGSVNIQVEVVARAGSPWTNGFDPSSKPNYQRLIAAARAHGVPDSWPAGPPAASPSAPSNRSRDIWQSKGGHYGHCHVPGNDHWDPGAIDTAKVPGGHGSPGTDPQQPADPNAYPGADKFGPGADNAFVTRLGELLVARGGGRFYSEGPSPQWGEADRNACRAFQEAQGWSGSDADGLPGPTTWLYLVTGQGQNIPEPAPEPQPQPQQPVDPDAYPGADQFGPGANNWSVTRLGQMLVRRGGARFYSEGPGPAWSDADRSATEAFQRAQGWSGSDADGLPGPTTWLYLVTGQGQNIPAPYGVAGTLGAWPGSPPVRYGYTNDAITRLQLRLRNAVGPDAAARLNPNGATGYYGPETRALVQYALRSHPETWDAGESEHDGLVGARSWSVIDQL
ncbi:peptidoglycan-binding protein (plasmid) [Kitasatospora sp. NBC_01246]|uniref:peptidoglycan-binding protein n=1 Tax=Kitasatospora sp. NBC_01246 TaxID=2903570 RepID=UPI002E2F0604|nr:peptidoglycan-binding protein [Kitasatospora sp. NBC_01246]